MMYSSAGEVPVGLNYKEKAMINESRAILGRGREEEDDDDEGCFNTKPKVYKGASDVYLQLNFLIESGSCNSSMMQPLLQQMRAPKAPERHCIMCPPPYSCCPSQALLIFCHSLILPSQGTCQVPWWQTVPWWLKRIKEGTWGRKEILLAFQTPYCQAKKKFLQSLHSQQTAPAFSIPLTFRA